MSEERAITIHQGEALPSAITAPAVQSMLPSADELRTMSAIAERIADTEFVPTTLRKRPAAVLACIAAGREMGVGPMQALQSIHVIQGRPAPSAQLMRALVLRAGHDFWTVEASDERVTVAGRRRGSAHEQTVTFGVKEAQRAGLADGNYKKYPRAMFMARATSELCRSMFPDVIAGFGYTPEEVTEFAEPVAAHIDLETGEITERPVPPPAQRTPPKPAPLPKPGGSPVTLMDWRICFTKAAIAKGWTEGDVSAVFGEMLDPLLSDAEQISLIKDMGVNLKKGILTRPDAAEPAAGEGELEGWDK